MRVITGTAKGRKLRSVEGLETRPTSDWTKESIFSIIQFDVEGRRVLDLFAGTGQMGIEALSRGAAGAVFVDTRRDCIEAIRENLDKTGFAAQSKVEQTDFHNYLKRCAPESFGLVFLDPPYGSGMLKSALSIIMRLDLVAEGGLIVCECEREDEFPAEKPAYIRGKDYHYGKTLVTVFRKQRGVVDESSNIPGEL